MAEGWRQPVVFEDVALALVAGRRADVEIMPVSQVVRSAHRMHVVRIWGELRAAK